jgi:hypothetical protein
LGIYGILGTINHLIIKTFIIIFILFKRKGLAGVGAFDFEGHWFLNENVGYLKG